jgi:hypothetical protein
MRLVYWKFEIVVLSRILFGVYTWIYKSCKRRSSMSVGWHPLTVFVKALFHHSVVERNPVKFNLSQFEVDSRKRFVSETMNELENIKSTLQSSRTLQKLEADKKQALGGGASSLAVKKSSVFEDERKERAARNMERLNDQYIQDEAARQESLVEQQDGSKLVDGRYFSLIAYFLRRFG